MGLGREAILDSRNKDMLRDMYAEYILLLGTNVSSNLQDLYLRATGQRSGIRDRYRRDIPVGADFPWD